MAKHKIEEIKVEVEELGWKLNSTEYKNLDTELSFTCPEGHPVLTTYAKWRGQHKCPICDGPPAFELSTKVVPKKKGVTRILALDQATHTSGWAIYDGSVLIKYGSVTMSHSSSAERSNGLKVWLANMIEIWKPDKVALEDIQLQQFGKKESDNVEGVTTFKVLAQLQGVLLDYLYEKKTRNDVVHTGVWRKHCEIKGSSRSDKKKSAQLKVKEWYDIDTTEDEADAICIGKYSVEVDKKNTEMICW